MKDLESKMEILMDRKKTEVLYPSGNPYRADVGGRLKNLRETCTVDRIRDFHKEFYHVSNMMVTVLGRLNHERLLRIVEDVETVWIRANEFHGKSRI
ncbi:hypothetical protein NECAME_12420 [Necator americanus]|uniref:Peptidase M16 C-terminal domain-containing protein n=1 Tax=Necator americanus TaxID=51031 RepID=W2T039_NECAM|nr:hypothetical protein NECAME_12420 [Necator americanus]ETN75365.1 hypothetical protein NECAME_12420 [Necator americanus]